MSRRSSRRTTVSKHPQLSPAAVGLPVTVFVPEPSAAAVMALAGVGLLKRRREQLTPTGGAS